jgi:membrane protein DedA with SNARE-associated domain
MSTPELLIAHWGYLAIFGVVILGNMGLPIPEETILLLAGYLVWEGQLRLLLVLLVGVLGAVTGDNLGYWIGRKFGRPALERYGHWVLVTPDRLDAVQRAVTRYGALTVFVARFLPGLRFLAGPVSGMTGLRPLAFIAANVCGAAVYVPTAVGLGYAVGYGFGEQLARLKHLVGQAEHLVLIVVLITTLLLAARARHTRRPRQTPRSNSPSAGTP